MQFEDTHAIPKSRKIPVFYFQKSRYRYLSSIPVYRYFPVYRRGLIAGPETRNPEAAPSKSSVYCVPQCPPDKPAPSLGVRAKFCSRIVAPRSEKFHEWASFFSHGHSPALLCSVRSEECICSPEPQFPRLPPVCPLQKTTLIFLYMPKVVGFGTFRVSAKSVVI